MKNLFCPKINEKEVKIRGKTQKSTFLAQKQFSVPLSNCDLLYMVAIASVLGLPRPKDSEDTEMFGIES